MPFLEQVRFWSRRSHWSNSLGEILPFMFQLSNHPSFHQSAHPLLFISPFPSPLHYVCSASLWGFVDGEVASRQQQRLQAALRELQQLTAEHQPACSPVNHQSGHTSLYNLEKGRERERKRERVRGDTKEGERASKQPQQSFPAGETRLAWIQSGALSDAWSLCNDRKRITNGEYKVQNWPQTHWE